MQNVKKNNAFFLQYVKKKKVIYTIFLRINVMKGKELTNYVFKAIKDSWPVHPSNVCRELGLECTVSNISKIKYHFNLLEKNEKIRTKKVDRALVAWPVEIERLRLVHEFMRED